MLVEIPDWSVIFAVVLSFVVGLAVIFLYNTVKPFIKLKAERMSTSYQERLEYYEKQLIDMKIRLDSLELQENEPNNVENQLDLKELLFSLLNKSEEKPKEITRVERPEQEQQKVEIERKIEPNNPIDVVLQLITTKPMTSRDIQITLKRSREHISRMMKKLYDEGLVNRNEETKPYTYVITEKGKNHFSKLSSDISIA